MAGPIGADFIGVEAADIMKVNTMGTLSLMNSAIEFAGPELSSVVFLSTAATIAPPPPHLEERLYTEADVRAMLS
jgi:nucleoside-diphosphate-sugar epimerase